MYGAARLLKLTIDRIDSRIFFPGNVYNAHKVIVRNLCEAFYEVKVEGICRKLIKHEVLSLYLEVPQNIFDRL